MAIQNILFYNLVLSKTTLLLTNLFNIHHILLNIIMTLKANQIGIKEYPPTEQALIDLLTV